MVGFSVYSNPNNMLSSGRQQSNAESKFLSRNDLYLVLCPSKMYINLYGNNNTVDSFNNKGRNQDFSSADINSIVSAIRNKQSSPAPAPAPAKNTVSSYPNHHHAYSNADMLATITCPNPTSGRVMEVTSVNYRCGHHDAPNNGNM